MAEFSWSTDGSRAEAAKLLRRIADGLDGDGTVELEQGGARLALSVPEQVAVEVDAEIDPETGATELEVELSWPGRRPASGGNRSRARKPADA